MTRRYPENIFENRFYNYDVSFEETFIIYSINQISLKNMRTNSRTPMRRKRTS